MVDGCRLFIRHREECVRKVYRRLWFDQVYFRCYRPSGDDCVVDFGAGLGTEIVMLGAREPGLRYVAVEIQPSVYECLALTLAQLPGGFEPFALGVSNQGRLWIDPTREGIDATAANGTGAVPIETIGWDAFVERHRIGRIDLLKMNIEGGEADLLELIDLARVQRAIVAVHDFRADRGDGEHFRTRSRVKARLTAAGFTLTRLDYDWIFAARAS